MTQPPRTPARISPAPRCVRGPITCLLFSLGAAVLQAQTQPARVIGRVVGGTGEDPIPNARVEIVGTIRTTTTDQDGRYAFQELTPGRIIIRVSAIGHEARQATLSVAAGETVTQDFSLERMQIALDELVITVTGPSRRRMSGNAITRVDAAPVVGGANVNTFTDLLQGRAAGVQIQSGSGTTGSSARIRVRGSNSISLNNDPLVYVDGVRMNQMMTPFDDLFRTDDRVSRLSDLNPDDIESIDIIKGPAASTLYGTEAANGVIRITTKRGQAGPPRWNAWVQQGVVANTAEFVDNFLGLCDGTAANCIPDGAGGVIDACQTWQQFLGWCTVSSVQTANPLMDDASSPFTPGHHQQYGVNVSGGSSQIQYFLSGEWESEDGVYGLSDQAKDRITQEFGGIPNEAKRPNALERFSLRGNVRAQVLDNADVALSVGLTQSDVRLPPGGNFLQGILTNGLLGRADGINDNWAVVRPDESFFLEFTESVERVVTSLNGSWQPLPWLTARGTFGVDFTSQADVNLQRTGTGPALPDPPLTREGGRRSTRRDVNQYTVDLGATGQVPLTDRVSSRTSAGLQYFRTTNERITSSGALAIGRETISREGADEASESFEETITLGVFLEQTFGLNDRLFLTGALRIDDNSTFGRDFNLETYGKLSASYVISEEPWFPEIPWLQNLRVRGAWGESGLQPGILDALRIFDGVTVIENGQPVSGVTLTGVGNTGLEPERSRELELGLDANLLDGRVGLELTYFDKNTTNALVERTLAPSLGQTLVRFENLGEVSTSGIEGVLTAQLLETSSVVWDLSLSGSILSNELVDLGQAAPLQLTSPLQRHVEGYPLGGFWERSIESFSDANADGLIDPTEVVVSDTLEFQGYSQPRYEAALSSTVILWDRVTVNALFDYRGGHRQFNDNGAARCFFLTIPCRGLNDPSAPLEEQAAASSLLIAPLLGGPLVQAGYFEPGWFARLRELGVTVTAPPAWAEALRVDRLALTVAGRNLFLLTDYSGPDPEVNAFARSEFGVTDFAVQPQVTTWTARLTLTF